MKKFLLVFLAVFVLFGVPAGVAYAEDDGSGSGPANPGGDDGGPVNPGGDDGGSANPGETVEIRNPINAENFQEFLNQLINVLLVFAIPIVVFMVVLAGFIFVVSGSNPARRQTAFNIIKYAIIGLVVILLARVLVSVVQGLF